MNSEHIPRFPADTSKGASSRLRIAIAALLMLLSAAYIMAIVAGNIPEARRVDGASLALAAVLVIAITIVLQPDLLDPLKGLEMSGFKIEMLERVREWEAEQAIELQDMPLMLPLLLPAAERKHLLNLACGATANYKGTHSLGAELRRLRSLELIRMRGDKRVAIMKDGLLFDPQNFIKLTDLGKGWSKRITETESRDSEAVAPGPPE